MRSSGKKEKRLLPDSAVSGAGKKTSLIVGASPEKVNALVLELQKHQEELESQNEELRIAQQEIELQNEELRLAQEELEQSRRRYMKLYDGAPVSYLTLDRHGTIIEANLTAAHFLGADHISLPGRSFYLFIEESDRDTCFSFLREIFNKSGRCQCEIRMDRAEKGGSWALLEGRREGVTCLLSMSDITERKGLEAKLMQSKKMEAIGRLAGGISHEFNNLLAVITGFTSLVRDSLPEGDNRRSDLDIALNAAHNAARLTQKLLTFSRKTTFCPKVLDINAEIEARHRMFDRIVGETINVKFSPDPGKVFASVDSIMLEEMLLNLVFNAKDAMPEGGVLTIKTSCIAKDEVPFEGMATSMCGEYVMLEVSDTGTGLNGETGSLIFEPFFTTKEPGKGTGLGLAIVHGIVGQHGGEIRFRSQPGKGTTFMIYFRREEQGEADLQEKPYDSPMPEGSGTIVVVEDMVEVRTLMRRFLASRGYTVLEAENGREALELCKAKGDTINLVITDILMPLMGGRELVRHLRQTAPHIKVLFVSGYMDESTLEPGEKESDIGFLQKPFTEKQLIMSVHALLADVQAETVNRDRDE